MAIFMLTVKKARLIIVFLFAIVTCWKLYCLTWPSQVHILMDNNLSHELKLAVQKKINEQNLYCKKANVVYDALIKEYPFVSQITIQYKASGIAFMYITCQRPRMRLHSLIDSSDYILMEQGALAKSNRFASHLIENLPLILLSERHALRIIAKPSFYTSLLNIKAELFDNYSVTWRSKDEINLKSKANNLMLLVTDRVSIHEEDKFTSANRIYESAKDRYQRGIKIDLRLKGQLICGPIGGEDEKSSI